MRTHSPESRSRNTRQRGFSLIELLVATAILLFMMAGVFRQVGRLQQYASAQEMRRDMFANARQVMDQFDREIRLAGYPNKSQFCVATCTGGAPISTGSPENDPKVAVKSLIFAGPNQIMFEGDIEGDGSVQSVAYSYSAAAPAGQLASCPCLLRGEVQKVVGDPYAGQTTLANQAVVLENVQLPAGNAGIFTFYRTDGQVVNPGGGMIYTSGAGSVVGSISEIRMIKIMLNVQTQNLDMQNRSRPMASLSLVSHLNNHY